jgi:hypothetical protein
LSDINTEEISRAEPFLHFYPHSFARSVLAVSRNHQTHPSQHHQVHQRTSLTTNHNGQAQELKQAPRAQEGKSTTILATRGDVQADPSPSSSSAKRSRRLSHASSATTKTRSRSSSTRRRGAATSTAESADKSSSAQSTVRFFRLPLLSLARALETTRPEANGEVDLSSPIDVYSEWVDAAGRIHRRPPADAFWLCGAWADFSFPQMLSPPTTARPINPGMLASQAAGERAGRARG